MQTKQPPRFYVQQVMTRKEDRHHDKIVTLGFYERVPLCIDKYASRRMPYTLTAIGSDKAVINHAKAILKKLNTGWRPTKASETFRENPTPPIPWNKGKSTKTIYAKPRTKIED